MPVLKLATIWCKSFMESVSIILGACGMDVDSEATRPRVNGHRQRTYKYSLNEQTAKMTAASVLLKLQGREDVGSCVHPGALAFLEAQNVVEPGLQ